MKKILFGILGLVVVLVAVALVAPSFIDWNRYKAEISERAKAATGRDLVIGGDIRVTLLPAPALIANDVRLANLQGATAPEMARLKSLEVRIAPGPLLTGDIQVTTVLLVDPVIELEALADGRKNWVLAPADQPESAAAKTDPGKAGGGGPDVRLDNFTIENGTIIYRDAASGTVERAEKLNARVAAISLKGPIESSGSLIARGLPLSFDASIGEIVHGRTVPINLSLRAPAGGTKVDINGTLVSLTEAPKFKGKIKGEGSNLARLADAAGMPGLPGFAGQPYGLEGAVVASATGAEVRDLVLRLGESEATGTLDLALGDIPNVAAQIKVNHVNLDKWLAMPPPTAATAEPSAATAEGDGGGRGKATIPLQPARPAAAPAKAKAADGLVIPKDIAASANIVVDAVTFKGALIRQVRASAELAAGEITVSQLAAQFPGGSDVAAFGFVSAAKGTPQFDGEMELTVSDLRSVMDWLGVAPPPVPSDRLRKLTMKSNIAATPAQVQLTNIDVALDASRLTGGITLALRERLSFGASFILDRINLDGYLTEPGAAKPATVKGAPAQPAKEAAAASGAGTSAAAAAAPFAMLEALRSVDASVRLRVDSLVYHKTPVKGVIVDGTLFNGALELREASVDDLAGAKAKISGNVAGFGAIPELKNFLFELRAADTAPLFRLAGIEPPVPPKGLGEVSLKGRADGGLLAPNLKLSAGAAGAALTFEGVISALPTAVIDGTIGVRHGDVSALLRALAIDYRPAGPLGSLVLNAGAKGDADRIALNGIKASVGTAQVQGTATLALGSAKPKVTAVLTAGEITVDPFLPAQRTAALPTPAGDGHSGRPGIIPAAWPLPPAAAARAPLLHTAAAERWSKEALDLSALQAIDADVKLKANAVNYQAYRVENVDLAATLADGVLRMNQLTGTLFGGALRANGTVTTAGVPKVESQVALSGADVGRALAAVAGKQIATGTMEVNADLTTNGRSVAALVDSLAGSGALALRRVEVKGAAQGTAMAGALGVIAGLNQLGGALGGQAQGGGLADVTGTFKIDKGVARSDDLKLNSNLGTGQAKGTVDLPNWTIDVAGEVALAQNVLSQLLAQKTNAPQMLPLHIKGPLDAPNVKLDTSRLPAGGIPLPGVDKLLQKKGIGDVLQQVLPGQQRSGTQGAPQPETPAPQSQEQPPPQAQPQQQKPPRPEDLLKDLFKRR